MKIFVKCFLMLSFLSILGLRPIEKKLEAQKLRYLDFLESRKPKPSFSNEAIEAYKKKKQAKQLKRKKSRLFYIKNRKKINPKTLQAYENYLKQEQARKKLQSRIRKMYVRSQLNLRRTLSQSPYVIPENQEYDLEE